MKQVRNAFLFVVISLPVYPLATASGSVPGSWVETVQFHSALINATLPYNVILPRDYRASVTTRYPVLYLLHGFGGHYSDWLVRTNVADYAAAYRMIVVMPEGNDSWYVDRVEGINDKYESYVLKELMPDVDKRYRTIQSRYGRAIAGLSMGGYGAIKFGLKNPGVFAFAASMSGTMAAASWNEEDLKNLKSIRDSAFAVFGPVGSETRKANDIFEIVRSLSPARVAALPYFYLDCGTEDFFNSNSAQFAALLREKKIAHEYRELPGDHSWSYWDQQVQVILRIASEKLRMRPKRSSRTGLTPPKRKALARP